MTKLADHLKVKHFINPNTGDQHFTYFYKRKRCPTSLIEGYLSKQYIGYYLILRDLEDTKLWLQQAYDLVPDEKTETQENSDNYSFELIRDEKNHLIIKSLFFSSLIFYGKCFTQAKGRGIKLEKSIIPEEYQNKHDIIMTYRHTLAAHSGEGKWDTGKVKLVLPPNKNSNAGIHIIPETYRLDFEDDRVDEHRFLELVNIVHSKAKSKSEIIGQKIINEIIIPKGKSHWYKTCKKG